MEAQAWSYGVSWYSDIDFTLSAKGGKLKLANGNFVVSEIYAFNYVSICIGTKSGKKTIHSGLGNNGSGRVDIAILEKESDGRGKNKGTFSATGTLELENMYNQYEDSENRQIKRKLYNTLINKIRQYTELNSLHFKSLYIKELKFIQQ